MTRSFANVSEYMKTDELTMLHQKMKNQSIEQVWHFSTDFDFDYLSLTLLSFNSFVLFPMKTPFSSC